MMESQETNNPQAETSATDPTSEQNPFAQGANPNGENSEANSDTAPDAQAQKELQGDGTDTESSATSEQQECTAELKAKHSESASADQEPQTAGSLTQSEKLLFEKEQADNTVKQQQEKKINQLEAEIAQLRQTLQTAETKSQQLQSELQNQLGDRQNKIEELEHQLQQVTAEKDKAQEMARQLEQERVRQLETEVSNFKNQVEDKNRQLELANRRWQEKYDLLNQQLKDSIAELSRTRQGLETRYRQQDQDLQNRYKQLAQEFKAVQQEKDTLQKNLADAEASRGRLLSETEFLKRNRGTHYDGTSARPQHHVLTGEYKTLKEQHLDPLATSLFTFMAALDPELKQQRREKLNDIRAAISATVLIGGQAIMRGESSVSAELPSGMLEKIQKFLCELLELGNQVLPQKSVQHLTKAANLAQGKVQYPAPGQWKEQDFQDASAELSARLYQALIPERTSLSQDIGDETQKAIHNALRFLERAALADPPASLSLYNEGTPFRSDYHEAAKGLEDEGTVIKTIYPVYLVNGEAKVKAVVLTKPSGEMSPGALPPNPITNAPETTPTDITGDATEKIRLEGKLEGKRESLIKVVKKKWFEFQHSLDKTGETRLTEKLSKLARIHLIEELLENEIPKGQITLEQFEKKVDEMLAAFSSQ